MRESVTWSGDAVANGGQGVDLRQGDGEAVGIELEAARVLSDAAEGEA